MPFQNPHEPAKENNQLLDCQKGVSTETKEAGARDRPTRPGGLVGEEEESVRAKGEGSVSKVPASLEVAHLEEGQANRSG